MACVGNRPHLIGMEVGMGKLALRVVMVMLSVVAVFGGVLVYAAHAQAADGCYGDYCSGRDPSTTGVNGVPCAEGASTVRQIDVKMSNGLGGYYKVGVLQVRWSARCQTNWTRLDLSADAYGIIGINALQDTGYRQYKQTRGNEGGTGRGVFWTNMIYSPRARVMAYLTTTWPQPCEVCATDWV